MSLVSGCTHLHDQANADLAKEALQDFNDFKKTSGGPYNAMLRNASQMDAASTAFRVEVAKVKAAVITDGLAGKTWTQIKQDLENANTEHQKRLDGLANELANLSGEKGTATDTVGRIAQSLKAAQDKLATATDEQQKWEARQALFLSAIKVSAQLAVSTNKLDQAAIKQAGQDVLDQTVELEQFDTNGFPTIVTNKLSDVLKDDKKMILNGNLDDIIGKYTYKLFDPKAAPGLKVLVFSLGADLAKQQLDRANLEVSYLNDRIAVATERQRLLTHDDESINAATALDIISSRIEKSFGPQTNKVLQAMEKMRSEMDASALQDAFKVVATVAVFKTLYESRWEETGTRAAFLEHEHSIKLSAINAAEHEALITRGLQGLLVYHQGGLTEERIANFLRVAQSAALAYIGAGVN